MKRVLLRFCIFLAVTSFILVTFFLPAPPEAEANLCKVPRGGIPSIYMTEVNAMAGDVFSPSTEGNLLGNRPYNARVLMCNRKRDTKGKKIEKYRAERGARPGTVFGFNANLPLRIVRGKIRYYGFAPLEYAYGIMRQNGIWNVWVPIQLHFPKLKFPNKLDIPILLADRLRIRNQCEKILRPKNRLSSEWRVASRGG